MRGKKLFVLLFLIAVSGLTAQTTVNQILFSKEKLSVEKAPDPVIAPDISSSSGEVKSVTKAFFLSLFLPGTGEAYVGKTGYTKVFMSIELVGWGLFIANRINVNKREEDYKNYAAEHAGLNGQEPSDQYWIDIGKYDNIYLYNEQRRRDRNIEALYPENSRYQWQWDNYANRLYYDGYRIETRQIDENKIYIVGGIILNHVVSAINALRVARAHNRNIEELGLRFDFNYSPYAGVAALSLQAAF